MQDYNAPASSLTTKNPYKRSLLISNIIIVALVIFFVVPAILQRLDVTIPLLNNAPASSYIFALTNPVYSFTGKIEKVSRNTIVVSNQVPAMYLSEREPFTETDNTQLAQKIAKMTYTIRVTEETEIIEQMGSVPYRFKAQTLTGPLGERQAKTFSDLAVGQYIEAFTNRDLRFVGRVFKAQAIAIRPITTFSGVVVKKNNNEITAKGVIQQMGENAYLQTFSVEKKEREYRFTVNQDTELSNMRNEELSLTDIKVGNYVTVYTQKIIVRGRPVIALMIDPFVPPEEISSQPTSSPDKEVEETINQETATPAAETTP